MRKLLFFACILSAPLTLLAQRFAGHPSSTTWKQINTDTVRVVFPAGYEKQAADIVATAHALGYKTHYSIGDRIRKISIVLQPRTTATNGYVALGPWRSEFYLTPNQNSFELGSLPWHRFLALHEYRHIQQYGNFNKGISKAFSYLFGQDGLSLASSAAVPNWFWEGDAVVQETVMSSQGRGRLPYFHNDYRSLWLSGKNYSWMKLRNGSLRDFVPDHYRLGYMMVSYGREKYGKEFWRNVTDDAVRYKGLFYPFQRAVKKYSGKDYKVFRKEALEHFEKNVEATDKNDSASIWAGQQQKHFAENQEYPQWIDENNVVFVKNSFKRIPAFYIRDLVSGEDRNVRIKDIGLDNYFSYRNWRIAYAAYEPHATWRWIDYSVIKVLDLSTGKQVALTHRSNYFSPDISEDGKEVVAVEVQPGGEAALHILDAHTGAVAQRLPNPQQLFYTYPKFYGNNIVAAVRNLAGQMTLGLINKQSGDLEELLPYSYNVIGFPTVRGDTISFTAALNGRDHLFMLIGQKLFRVNTDKINSGTGNYQLSMIHNKAAFTAFTSAGFHMQVQESPELIPANKIDFANRIFNIGVAEMEQADSLNITAAKNYPVTRYKKAFRLINFHSWRPYISDPDYTFSIIGENVLNTFQAEVFFNYNRNEKFKQAGASLVYGGIFPYITGSFYGTFDRVAADTISAFNWNEYDARLGLQAPFNFTSGRSYKNLTLSAGINNKQVRYTGVAKTRYEDLQFYYADFSTSLNLQAQQARMHIYPRLGYSLFARYRTAVNELTARQMLLSNSFYLPGVDPTHNIVLSFAWQGRDTMQQYFFPNSFPFSRGYTNVDAPRMWKVGANYHLPLLYPDWGFGNIVYFLRVRGNAFYDYSEIKSLRTGAKFGLSSTGGEIFVDTKWWNEYEVTFGLRYSRLADGELVGLGPNQWEFILPINLLGR